MSQKEALRIKLTTGGGSVGILILVLATEGRKILETFALGGGNSELQRISLDAPYQAFRNALLDARFYSKYDPPVTSDLERYIQKVSKNLEFIDRLYDSLAKKKKGDLQFLFENELQVVLGDREIDFHYVYEPISDEVETEENEALDEDIQIDPEGDPAAAADGDAPDPVRYVPLAFALSPIEGTHLSDLKPGDEVFVKVSDRTHPLAEAFLEIQTALNSEDGASPPEEYLANLKELRENPAGGFWAILSLPDASEGLVSEEGRGIKVKVPHAPETMADPEDFIDEKTAMKGIHAEPHAGHSHASPQGHHPPARRRPPREEVPLKVILAFAAAAVVLSLILLSLI